MINQEYEGADQQARRTNVSTSTLENLQSTSVWQSWLAPLELVKDKQTAGAFNVFDQQLFAETAASVFAGKQAKSEQRAALLELMKTTLASGRKTLEDKLVDQRDGAIYVGAHAFFLDSIISGLVTCARQHVFAVEPRFAVMAVGGYGRGELAPFSDIDLLFVMPQKQTKSDIEFVEFILYILWDLGLSVGHASRTVDENLKAASDDVTIRTSLLEMRPIAGNNDLSDKLLKAFKTWLSGQPVLDFVEAKLTERDLRHGRFGGTRYAVEPNVKDGKGGLRDLHTLFWITKYAYRLDHIHAMLTVGILRSSEARAFAAAQRFLWTVRCFLHLHHGREDDRLTFDAQMQIAPQMGFSDRSGLRGVERFMKRYYLAARQVGNLTRIFCAALATDFDQRPRLNLRKFWVAGFSQRPNIKPFSLEGERLHLPDKLRFRDNRDLIIELFYMAQYHELDIHPDTLRRLTRAVRALNTTELQSPKTHERFLAILTDQRNPERVLRLMNEAGWLGKYLPDFGRIVGMMQFDMYHSYTVDEHTIKAVGNISDIEQGVLKTIAPVASRLIHELDSRQALFVAVLFHDIAKGRGGDHSVLGAEVAAQLCPLLGLNAQTTETVVWLIRHHLLMSKTAFRYDLNDPQTISDFAAEVQSPERLKLLLVLTVADILAVGPEIWNGWKASLMRDLYSRSEAVLGGAAPSEVSALAAADAMQATRLALSAWDDERFDAHAQLFYPSYWTNFSTESHLYHARLAEQFNAGEKKLLIDFKIDDDKESTILVVMAADHPGLFSRIVGAVAVAGCSIMNARINTRHDGTILDQFRIQDKDRQAVIDPQIQNRIAKIIEQSLAGDISLFRRLQERSAQITKRQKAMSVPPRVIVSNNRSNTHTVIEVNGADRPGLLYQITYHLVQLGLQINSATVSTYGEKVVDVFYVKDVYGLKIEREASQKKIEQTLMGVFDLQQADFRQNGTHS